MTARLAVLGNPVAHSLSPQIHRLFAQQAGLDIRYDRILVPTGGFRQTALAFMQEGLGCNITVPCKHDAYQLADEASDAAARAQAVNTLSKTAEGRLSGDNTDGPGLVADLVKNLGWQIAGRRLLVLGAGGAVSGILPSLADAGPALLHVCNRTHEKAEALVARQALPKTKAVQASQLDKGYDLIISGTSAGLSGNAMDLPPSLVADGSHCYDLIYAAQATPFLKWCRAQASCATADGLGMLVEQAALSFRIWFGKPVDARPVIGELRAALKDGEG